MFPFFAHFFTHVNHLFSQFQAFTKDNPVLAGIVSLWGLGVVTFILKGIPTKIYHFIKRQVTTTLVLNSQDYIYYDFLKWVSTNNLHSFVRTLNFNNNRHGWGSSASLTIGYGTTFFFFKKNFFIMSRYEVQANQTEYMKEQLSITVLGRNQKIFRELFDEIAEKDEEANKYTKVFNFKEGHWHLLCKQYKRPMETVVIDKKAKKELISHIDNFYASKDWYMKNGIPYRTGILFQGPPGTGKTSLIKAVCSYYDKNLYLINLEHISDAGLHQALSTVPEGAVVAIEDIDACNVSLNRTEEAPEVSENSAPEHSAPKVVKKDKKPTISFISLSGVLNAIDGVASAENRILIATTNHPEDLDAALLREGRFDVHLNIGNMTNDMFKEYMVRFYEDFNMPEDKKLKDGVAACKLQKMVFENRNSPDKIIEELLV